MGNRNGRITGTEVMRNVVLSFSLGGGRVGKVRVDGLGLDEEVENGLVSLLVGVLWAERKEDDGEKGVNIHAYLDHEGR